MLDEKLPPSNKEAEISLVGAALIDPDSIPRVASILKPADFHYQELREIWAAMVALYGRGEPVDVLTVSDELHADNIPLLISYMNDVPTSVHSEHYARIVARDAERRALIAAATAITQAAYDDSQDPRQVEELGLRLIMEASTSDNGTGTKSLKMLASEYYDRIEALARSDGVLGLPTGYGDLDKIVGGMQRSDLVILAARPRMGKTSLALCIARNVARVGKRILFFSLEMSRDQIMRRLVALESAISVSTLKAGKLMEAEWGPFMQASDQMSKLPLWVNDTPGLTPSRVRAESMKTEALAGGPLDLIVVDYLQLMRPDKRNANRYEAVTEIGQSLKALAKDLNVPVLALSQLNRSCEARSDKRPQLHDLRESGDLEQTANVVIMLYRDEVYNPGLQPGIAEAMVVKNRDGQEGTAHLHFDGHLTRFSSVDVRREVL